MTAATLLDRMELFADDLETGTGEPDETRALAALNVAQDYWEALAASLPGVLGNRGTVTTSASTETSVVPTGLLRIDSLWFLDPGTSRPTYKLKRIVESGGHAPSLPWPLQTVLASGSGAPRGYFTDLRDFYWLPLPDATHTIRWYGFQAAADLASRTSTFLYPDIVSVPLAQFATRVLRTGRDDPVADLDALAATLFLPVVRTLRKGDRSRAIPRLYTESHET